MMKKVLYIYAATVSYAFLIGFLLLYRWNIPMIPANWSRIAMAFKADGALWLALIGGGIAWVVAMAQITMLRVAPPTPEYTPSAAVYGEPLLEPQGRGQIDPNDPRWKDMYKPGARPAPAHSEEPEPVHKEVPKELPPYPKPKSPPIDYAIIETANRTADRIRISGEIVKASYRDIGQAKIGEADIDIVAIADNDIAALLLIDATGGSISATPDYWYSGEKRYDNPLPALAAARDALQAQIEKYLPGEGIFAKAFLIFTHGSPANMAEAKKLAKEFDIELVKSGDMAAKLPELLKKLPARDADPDNEFDTFINTLLGILKKTPIKKAA